MLRFAISQVMLIPTLLFKKRIIIFAISKCLDAIIIWKWSLTLKGTPMTSRIEYTFVVHYYGHLIVTVVQKIIAQHSSWVLNIKIFLQLFPTKDLEKASKLKFGQNAFSWVLCSFLMLSWKSWKKTIFDLKFNGK